MPSNKAGSRKRAADNDDKDHDNKRNKKYGPNDSENCQIGSSARHHPLGCKHYIDMLRRIVALHDAEAAVARLKKELEEMGDELDEANWKITKLKAKAKK